MGRKIPEVCQKIALNDKIPINEHKNLHENGNASFLSGVFSIRKADLRKGRFFLLSGTNQGKFIKYKYGK